MDYLGRAGYETGFDLSGGECFELLHAAMLQGSNAGPAAAAAPVSLWCMWSFTNVLYWQLQDVHHPESPILIACMPDEHTETYSSDDVKSKMAMKGEIFNFIIRTASEFATRQTTAVDPSRIVQVTMAGLTNSRFNGTWRRTDFDVDNQPAFTDKTKNFYLHYRAGEGRWVLDDVIEPTGVVYSVGSTRTGTVPKGSSKNASKMGLTKDSSPLELLQKCVWSSSASWGVDRRISVTVKNTTSPHAHGGKVATVSGVPNGGSCNDEDNGDYFAQPPYDNVNGATHFIKPNPRRHLIFGKSANKDMVTPVCNGE